MSFEVILPFLRPIEHLIRDGNWFGKIGDIDRCAGIFVEI